VLSRGFRIYFAFLLFALAGTIWANLYVQWQEPQASGRTAAESGREFTSRLSAELRELGLQLIGVVEAASGDSRGLDVAGGGQAAAELPEGDEEAAFTVQADGPGEPTVAEPGEQDPDGKGDDLQPANETAEDSLEETVTEPAAQTADDTETGPGEELPLIPATVPAPEPQFTETERLEFPLFPAVEAQQEDEAQEDAQAQDTDEPGEPTFTVNPFSPVLRPAGPGPSSASNQPAQQPAGQQTQPVGPESSPPVASPGPAAPRQPAASSGVPAESRPSLTPPAPTIDQLPQLAAPPAPAPLPSPLGDSISSSYEAERSRPQLAALEPLGPAPELASLRHDPEDAEAQEPLALRLLPGDDEPAADLAPAPVPDPLPMGKAPLHAGANPLARYLRDNNVRFTGLVVGSSSVAVLRHNGTDAPVMVEVGDELPDTSIRLLDLRDQQATFQLGNYTEVLTLDLRR